jgi:hypothetical protein
MANYAGIDFKVHQLIITIGFDQLSKLKLNFVISISIQRKSK